MDGTERIQPSSRYYSLAFLFWLAAIGLVIYFFITDIQRIRNSLLRMDVPGQMDLDLKHHQTYTVFVEHATHPAAGVAEAWTVHCEVHALPNDEVIPTVQNGTTTYTWGTRQGVSILEFDPPKDGTYMLACTGPAQIYGQKVAAAIGGGASKSITAVMGKSFLVLMGGIVIGTLIFVRVAMLRLQSRRDIRERGLKPV